MLIGLTLGIFGTLFEELGTSITKHKSKKHNTITLGVISTFFSLIAFLLLGLYKYYFLDIEIFFNKESFLLLGVRLLLEIAQTYITILAISKAERSTFSIIRILTIPLLIIADIIIGYNVGIYSIIGMSTIVLAIVLFGTKIKAVNRKGRGYVLFTAINAAITISLFKYSISHYGNSVEFDQFVIILGILIFFMIYNYKKNKQCVGKLIFREKQFLLQGIFIGLTSLTLSYTYLFLNASVATTIKRSGEMFRGIISGFILFKEKKLLRKLILFLLITIGLIITLL